MHSPRQVPEYGQTIHYTAFDGSHASWNAHGFTCEQELNLAVTQFVKHEYNLPDGWRQPKWWQWWRWDDTRIDSKYLPTGE